MYKWKYINIVGLTLDMTDEEVRKIAKSETNGGYCHKICKRCGSFWVSEEGDIKTAKIVDSCKECND